MALAPEALAALLDALETLLIAVGWVVAIGLLWIWRHTVAVLLVDIANALNFNASVWGVHLFTINAGDFLLTANTDVQNALSAYALGCDIAVGKFLHGLTWIFQEAVSSTEWVARELLHATTWTLESYLPAFGRSLVAPFVDVVNTVRWAVHHFGDAEAFLRRAFGIAFRGIEAGYRWTRSEVGRLERDLLRIDRKLDQVIRREGHKAGAAAAIPAIGALPVPIGLTIRDLKRLARKHEGIFAASVFAGLMANVLGLSSWRCLTRGPVGRVSRALCGLGSNALADLLSLLVDALVITRPCDVMTIVTAGAELILTPVGELAQGIDAAIKGCNYNLAGELEVEKPELPPLQVTNALGL